MENAQLTDPVVKEDKIVFAESVAAQHLSKSIILENADLEYTAEEENISLNFEEEFIFSQHIPPCEESFVVNKISTNQNPQIEPDFFPNVFNSFVNALSKSQAIPSHTKIQVTKPPIVIREQRKVTKVVFNQDMTHYAVLWTEGGFTKFDVASV